MVLFSILASGIQYTQHQAKTAETIQNTPDADVLLPSFISICVSFSSVESVEELNLDKFHQASSQSYLASFLKRTYHN